MTSSVVALIYSADTGRLREWVVPDDDSEIIPYSPPNPPPRSGLAVLVITRDQYVEAGDLNGLQGLINNVTGKTPETDDRYILVDAGENVAHVAFACPLCGDVAPPGLEMRKHPAATLGAFFVGSSWFAPPTPRVMFKRFSRSLHRRSLHRRIMA